MTGPQLIALNVGIAVAAIVVQLAARGVVAWFTTKDYFAKQVQAAKADGFIERQITTPDGTVLNYAEQPNRPGTPLLLIPGQGCVWQEYCKTFPYLTDTFHVVAVDVPGHGSSTWDPAKYTANQIADDLAVLCETAFTGPAVIAGHSSGGLIAAALAARHPDQVSGVMFEDAPFFSTEPDRVARTYVGIDSYASAESFLAQADSDAPKESDWVSWYMPRSYWQKMFGPKLWPLFTRLVVEQRRRDPDSLPEIRWLSVKINRIWESMSHPFDLRFTKAFADNSWFAGFDQSETLAQIHCPTVFLKATTRFDKQGNLLAALDDDDLARVESLLPDNQTVHIRSSHDIHFAHPKKYSSALKELAVRASTVVSRDRVVNPV